MSNINKTNPQHLKSYSSSQANKISESEENIDLDALYEEYGIDTEGLESGNWEEDPFASEGDSYSPPDVTRQELLDLYRKVDAANRPDEENLLEILREAMREEAQGNHQASAQAYDSVAVEVGLRVQDGEEDLSTDDLDQGEEDYSDVDTSQAQPTRVDGNTYYYESKEGESYQLVASGESRVNRISTAGEIVLVPVSPEDDVEVSESGGKLTVKFKHKGKTEKFMIDADQAQHIHIASDRVSGDIDHVTTLTTGTSSMEKYVPMKYKNEVANTLDGVAEQMGYYSYEVIAGTTTVVATLSGAGNQYTFGYSAEDVNGESKLVLDSSAKAMKNLSEENKQTIDDVQEMTKMISDALRESDSGRSKEKWNAIYDKFDYWRNQHGLDGADDRAQMIFNILYTELGESHFADLLQKGVFPGKFVDEFSMTLGGSPTGSSDLQAEITHKNRGGPDWSHATSADFLNRNTANNQPADDWNVAEDEYGIDVRQEEDLNDVSE